MKYVWSPYKILYTLDKRQVRVWAGNALESGYYKIHLINIKGRHTSSWASYSSNIKVTYAAGDNVCKRYLEHEQN